ncbi:MAG: hypothetical protein N3A54_03285, partial [Patescibacteria group bacterium]|nr:hypothetical protein [Patescibacteria group bacterium]
YMFPAMGGQTGGLAPTPQKKMRSNFGVWGQKKMRSNFGVWGQKKMRSNFGVWGQKKMLGTLR